MTWEQKIQACQAIGDFSLRMRKPGDWYVSQSAEKKKTNGAVLCGGCVTGAKTPEEAVNQHWDWLTSDEDGDRVVLHSMSDTELRDVRWNGFMWQELPREERAA